MLFNQLVPLAEAQTLFQKLTPLNQLRFITGIVVVLVLGLVLYLIIKAGAHMVRGFSAAAKRLPSNSSPDHDDWARKPLNEPLNDDG